MSVGFSASSMLSKERRPGRLRGPAIVDINFAIVASD